VLVVSIDGLRPDAIYAVATPSLRALAARGSYTWQAQTITPSNTLPSHISMVTGVTPAVHRITWDEYLPGNGKLTVPTLFGALAAAGKRSAMVAGKDKFLTLRDAGGMDACLVSNRGDVDVANQTILQIDAGFDLVFVHFPDVDLTGHAKRWMSPEYLQNLQVVDQALGRILNAVPDNMPVILTADHGGSGVGHGTTAAEHMTIPWVIQGPRIKAGNALSVRVNTTDTAVTAGYILGVKISDSVSGRVVSEAFLN
jgi:predicted AlkP superfamily pyrophosphatase or phosphodiesterase